ncbi:MAG: M48 family peptidase [Dehalococcoidia bacterium]|nr:MAG: M48 family peptidase [Dehalococcoidia bacterium]
MDNVASSEPVLDAARQAQARRYARTKRYLSLVDYLLGGFLLVALLASGLSSRLIDFLALSSVAGALIYFLVLTAAYALITAPLDYYSGLVLPRRYGLSRQTLVNWLGDHLKTAGLGLFLGSGLVSMAYWLLSFTPEWWWLWGWVAVMLISLVLSVLAPVIILPMFFKTKPLADGEIKARLEKLAQAARVKVRGIYTVEFSAKNTTANAALMGAGATRRILLSDTLLDKYTPPEITVIMAHEMGHQRHRDMLRLFIFQGLVMLASFFGAALVFKALTESLGFKDVSDAAALPLLILVFGLMGLVMTPLTAFFTRRVESQADFFAITLTGDSDSFISAMAKLTDQNLAEGTPPRWVEVLLDDHPSYRQRVAMAQRFKATQLSANSS